MRDLEAAGHIHDRPDFLTPICWGALGLFAGAMAVRSYSRSDEDRPPIIVRGGSLRFISGDANHPDQKYRVGRNWHATGGHRQPDHKQGKPVNSFVVVITGGSGSHGGCTDRITIRQGGEEFIVSIRAYQGKPAPAVHGLFHQIGGSAANPALIFDYQGTNEIESVSFVPFGSGKVESRNPTQVAIWPV